MRSIKLLLIPILLLALTTSVFGLSKATHMGMSLLLPGSGELAMGKSTIGTVLLTSDILAMSAYLHLGSKINDLGDSYRIYAQTYANAAIDQEDQYYLDMQSYMSSDVYNEYFEMVARNYYLINGYHPDEFQEFISSHTYSDDISWQWASEDYWKEYKSIRTQYQKARLNKNLALGAMLLNRMISLLDVAFTKGTPHQSEIYFSPTGSYGLMFNYRYHF